MELIDTLKEAQAEIRDLRRRNELLSAKVEVMDNFMQVLNTAPFYRAQDMSPDVVHKMGQLITELEQTQTSPTPEPEPGLKQETVQVKAKSPVDLRGGGRFA